MGSNDDAVVFLHKTRPAQLDLRLIASALQCRQADADPDSLFPERTSLPSQVEACAAVLVAAVSASLNSTYYLQLGDAPAVPGIEPCEGAGRPCKDTALDGMRARFWLVALSTGRAS